MKENVWVLKPTSEKARDLSDALGLPLPVARILDNRGIHEVEEARFFLEGTLEDLHDPFLMKDMGRAVERIRKAVAEGERILIFGDYDVDGILSVVSLSRALESLGGRVEFFIPDRLREGYGLKEKYIGPILERKVSLVISVDCGVKATAFVQEARKRGLDVIITDHHQPGPSLPPALAILNPALPGERYPFRQLAGIGVVFKLIQALYTVAGKGDLIPHYLKLVSIGTVADVVELKDENRIFVKYGLRALEDARNPGLRSLMENCGVRGRRVTVGDVGFRIAPRINAAGRMGLTDLAVRLFFSPSSQEAAAIAGELDRLNSRRQRIEEKVFEEAQKRIRKRRLDEKYRILVLGCQEWHRGVIGIVASKIKDVFYRPTILFSYEEDRALGSGRSVRGFSLIDCLEEHRDLLLSYGGHTMAVGCELDRGDMETFRNRLNVFARQALPEDMLQRRISIDSRIEFDEIEPLLLDHLVRIAPFGLGNPRPLFLTEDVEVASRPRGMGRNHGKFLVKKNGKAFEALAWGRGDRVEHLRPGDRIDIVYSLHTSVFQGEETLALSVEDLDS